MSKLVCSICREVHDHIHDGKCPIHPDQPDSVYDFKNSDDFLKTEVKRVLKERRSAGLDEVVGGLQAIIINTETGNQKTAVQELLDFTGYEYQKTFSDEEFITSILKQKTSADILIRSRKSNNNPFKKYNLHPKSKHLPNTRLETFIFNCSDLKKYFQYQVEKGHEFLTNEILEYENYYFLQSVPSKFTGISVGLIQWKKEMGNYKDSNAERINWEFTKLNKSFVKNIGYLDHTATRVRAVDRDKAIIEFMELTNYNFEFAIYVKMFNSITNVARLSSKDFAMVFTSGIVPFKNLQDSGPTEKFIYNYGTRTHHMAFVTDNIEETYKLMGETGMKFLVELIGSPKEGLKQTFTIASPNTLLVNEYIHRYGDFDGFFTKQNVTLLTGSTDKQ
jgi:4-hydroxyphenylpyruvate dioxygenase-like putative hemolysin